MPISRGHSQPRVWTQVFCIAGGFFTIWATRETQEDWSGQPIPSLRDLPNRGIELGSPALQPDSLKAELLLKPELINTWMKIRKTSVQWSRESQTLEKQSLSVVPNSLQPYVLQLTRFLCPWDFPCKNTGMGSHSLLKGLLLTQGSNPTLPCCRLILYCLSHQWRPVYMLFYSFSLGRQANKIKRNIFKFY